MKKMIAIMMAGTLVLGTSVFAFAEDPTPTPAKTDAGLNLSSDDKSTSSLDVNVKVLDKDITTVYYIDVEWYSMDFTYTFGTGDTWNPETHTYQTGDGKWDKTKSTVDIINHSNAPVNVAAGFIQEGSSSTTATMNGVTASVALDKNQVDTGVGLTYTTADKATATVSISGVPSIQENFKIDTLTITLSAVAKSTE